MNELSWSYDISRTLKDLLLKLPSFMQGSKIWMEYEFLARTSPSRENLKNSKTSFLAWHLNVVWLSVMLITDEWFTTGTWYMRRSSVEDYFSSLMVKHWTCRSGTRVRFSGWNVSRQNKYQPFLVELEKQSYSALTGWVNVKRFMRPVKSRSSSGITLF